MVEDRCVFCLGEEDGGWSKQEGEETRVGVAEGRRLLGTFNTVCAYLQNTQRKQMGLEGNSGGVSLERFLEPEQEKASSSAGEFKELPKMCGACVEKLVEVEKLREGIRNLVLEFRRIIFESRNPGRCSKSEGGKRTKKSGTKSVSSGMSRSKFQGETEQSDPEVKCEPGFENCLSPSCEKSVDDSDSEGQMDSDEESESDNDNGDEEESDGSPPLMSVHSSEEETDDESEDKGSSNEVALPVKKPRKSVRTRCYPCTICGDKISPQNFLEHVQGHVGSYATKCPNYDVCLFATSNPIGVFYTHFRHNPECNKVASQTQNKDKVHNRTQLVCQTCGFTTTAINSLRSHLKLNHERSLEKTEECPVEGCSVKFCVRQSVELHLPFHDQFSETRQQCQVCLQRFDVYSIEDHLKSKHDVQEIISCQHCQFRFSTRHALLKHLFVHRYHQLTCDICGNNKAFTRYSDLVQHYSSAHQIKLFECTECHVSFSKKAGLRSHNKSKHASPSQNYPKNKPKELSRFPCDICLVTPPPTFKSQACLVSHQIKVHGALPFSCSICGETFTTAKKLKVHENEHKGIRKEFRCEVPDCGRIFMAKKQLKRHVSVVHDNERHVCELCGKMYTGAQGLKHHYQTFHQKSKPFVCETCGECFSSGMILKRHALIHSEERPFVCKICGQTFRQNSTLKTHLEGHEKKGEDFKPTGAWTRNRKRKQPVTE